MKHARITHELIYAIQADRHLSKYLHLIKDAPAYPIIYDSKDRVLSMPPIINSQRKSRHRSPLHCIYGKTGSKIVPGKTTNIFIDTTATDKTKL